MTPTAFVSHPACALHDTGWGHPEHQGRLPALVRAVGRDLPALHEHVLQVEAEAATEEDLLLVHTPAYVRAVRERVEESAAEGRPLPLEGEVVVSGASRDAALGAVGAALAATEVVLAGRARTAFCAVRPPGRDVAADRPGGHSLFNTVAVAAAHLRARRGVGSVLVVDWGARAPLGTPGVVAELPGVRLASVHQQAPPALVPPGPGAAPGAGPRVCSVGVPAGTGGDGFAAALRSALEASLAAEAPDFVLLSLGLDVLSGDPLGALAVEPREVHGLTTMVREAAERACGGRLVSVLEGGYDAGATGLAVVQHLRALAGVEPA